MKFIILTIVILNSYSYGMSLDVEREMTVRKKLKGKLRVKSVNGKHRSIVAIIDSGIDYDNRYLRNRIYNPNKIKGFFGIDLTTKKISYKPKDIDGHGTHMAGIITMISPKSLILPIKVVSKKGTGIDSSIKAIKLAIKYKVDIINISLAGSTQSKKEKEEIQKAIDAGIVVVIAAGNSGRALEDVKCYPAKYKIKDTIVVMNSTDDNKRYLNSNYSKEDVDIAAPGVNMPSFSIINILTNVKKSGTSQSTAVISGMIASFKSFYPKYTPREIKRFLLSSRKYNKSLLGKNRANGAVNFRFFLIMGRDFLKYKGTFAKFLNIYRLKRKKGMI
jgi:subtilisin family serine protease